MNDTRSLWEKDVKHFIHPYTNYEKFATEGSVIYNQGKGHFIFDNDGNKYLDGIAGLWCCNIGHGREEIAEYMADQAAKLAYYNTFDDASSPPAANLSAKLSEICPGSLNHVFFGTGGSMANDTAIKIVHYYFNMLGSKKKKKILARKKGYHGSTYLAHAITGIEISHAGFDLPDHLVHHISAPYKLREASDMDEKDYCDQLMNELEADIAKLGPDNVACFIAEPIMGAGGVIVPPKDYLKRAQDICRHYNILFIADEVVTAFGRLGQMISCKENFDVTPDIITMAKGISSGYIPLGATVISETIHDVISKPKSTNPYFSHGFTYSGHALACGVGLKNIEIMERESLCEHVQSLSPYFMRKLTKLKDLPIVIDVRGSHYMLALEYAKDKTRQVPFSSETMIGKRIYHHCKKRGLIVRPIGSVTVLSPPLTYDISAIDQTVEILEESILRTMDDLSREGILAS